MSKLSRRSMLKLAASAPAAAALAFRSTTSTPSQGVLTYGLLFDEEAVEDIRRNFESELFSDVRSELQGFDYDSQYSFYENEIRYNDQLFTIRPLAVTIRQQAFLYLMTGSEDAQRMAVASVEQLMKFDRWDFFLDGDKSIGVQRAPDATLAVSLAADWLGDSIDAETRRSWLQVMAERGVSACYNSSYAIANPTEVVEWRFDPESTYFEHRPGNRTDQNRRAEITRNTNLRAIPASSLIIGAVVYALEFGESEQASTWLDLGTYSAGAFRDFFMPDGSYDEEVNYANYTATHLLQAAIVLGRHGSESLLDVVNWQPFVRFLLNMTLPTADDPYQLVNFGDSGNTKSAVPKRAALSFWIANEFEDGLAQWYALNRGGHTDIWSIMWYDSAVDATPPTPGPSLWISDLDRVVARTGWDAEDTVVGFRSGPPANHEHGDRNSILIKAFGQRLVTDPMRPPYSFSDPAWRMRLTEGHSAILIDGSGHEHHNGVEGTNASRSFARIKESGSGPGYAWWRSVATQPYRLVDTDIKNVIRSVVFLFDENVVVIGDFIDKYERPSTVTARFFADNEDGEVQLTAGFNEFRIQRPGAILRAGVASNVPFKVAEGKPFVPGEYALAHPFIDVQTHASNDILIVTSLALGRTSQELPIDRMAETGDGFRVLVGDRVVTATRHSVDVT